jgi:hypothetical protein
MNDNLRATNASTYSNLYVLQPPTFISRRLILEITCVSEVINHLKNARYVIFQQRVSASSGTVVVRLDKATSARTSTMQTNATSSQLKEARMQAADRCVSLNY